MKLSSSRPLAESMPPSHVSEAVVVVRMVHFSGTLTEKTDDDVTSVCPLREHWRGTRAERKKSLVESWKSWKLIERAWEDEEGVGCGLKCADEEGGGCE
jgi:hypothetical protein